MIGHVERLAIRKVLSSKVAYFPALREVLFAKSSSLDHPDWKSHTGFLMAVGQPDFHGVDVPLSSQHRMDIVRF